MIILRQKTYSGRVSNWVAGRIEKSIDKDSKNLNTAGERYHKAAREINLPDIEEKITSRYQKQAAVFTVPGGGNVNIPNKLAREKETIDELKEAFGPEIAKKAREAADSGKDIILHPKNSGTGSLAHELGHAKNNRAFGKKYIIGKNNKNRADFIDSIEKRSDSGYRTGIKKFIKGKSIVLEEKDANRSGIKILRKAGVDPDTMRKIQKSYEDSLQTYKSASNIYYKTPIMNRVRS